MITRTGFVIAGSAAMLLFAGVWTGYPELVVFGIACVVALLVAAVWLLARPKLVVVREISPARVEEGATVYGVLTVTNTGRWRTVPLAAMEAGRVSAQLPSLAAGGEFETVYPLPAYGRGRYVIPAVRIDRADPLHLLHSGRSWGTESVLYVYPRVHEIDPAPLGGLRDIEEPTSASSPHGGVAFHSLRAYEPGDDWRRIHWKSTARTGELMVRHNVVPEDPRHLVVLDTSVKPYDGTSFEEAVRVAASLCMATSKVGYALACRTTGDLEAAVGQGDEATAALDLLAGAQCSETDQGLSALADIVRDVLGTGERTTLSVVTGQADPGRLEVLTMMRAQFLTITLVQVGQSTPGVLPGVLTVGARTSAEFAATWNHLVRP